MGRIEAVLLFVLFTVHGERRGGVSQMGRELEFGIVGRIKKILFTVFTVFTVLLSQGGGVPWTVNSTNSSVMRDSVAHCGTGNGWGRRTRNCVNSPRDS